MRKKDLFGAYWKLPIGILVFTAQKGKKEEWNREPDKG